MFVRLIIAVLWVSCADDVEFGTRNYVDDGDATVDDTISPAAPSPAGGSNSPVSINLDNLPKTVTTETSINISVSSDDGAQTYRYFVANARWAACPCFFDTSATAAEMEICKANSYSDARALSTTIAESNLSVGKYRLCALAENAAGEKEGAIVLFEWEIVSHAPSTSPSLSCSTSCEEGCTAWSWSEWTPSTSDTCSNEMVDQTSTGTRNCDSVCSFKQCDTTTTRSRSVPGTREKDYIPPKCEVYACVFLPPCMEITIPGGGG